MLYKANEQHKQRLLDKIVSINMAVDRLHFTGHVDPWCRKNCDPNLFKDLEDVSHNIAILTNVAQPKTLVTYRMARKLYSG